MGTTNVMFEIKGMSIDLGDLRRMVTWADQHALDDNATVSIYISPEYANPTDPGGEIRVSITAGVTSVPR